MGFWRVAILVPFFLIGCSRGPVFSPDPFHHELLREIVRAGYLAEHVPPELVCLAPAGPLCRCDLPGLEGAVAGVPLEHRLDLNRASTAEIERLPGIGPGIAARIVAHRETAPFTSPEDLMDVPGIGPGRFARIGPLVWVGPPGPDKSELEVLPPDDAGGAQSQLMGPKSSSWSTRKPIKSNERWLLPR